MCEGPGREQVTSRDWVLLLVLGTLLLMVAVLVGATVDRVILHNVTAGPPQRLAAAMGGLFAGGLMLFAGMLAWFVRRPK